MSEETLAQLQEQATRRYVSPDDMAMIYMGLGDKEQAWKYLQLAYQDLLRRMHLTP